MVSARKLEIACFNLQSAVIAQANGADRIELCENYKEGGLTPSFDCIQQARKQLTIPLHVIIRPRAGNFVFSPTELETMKDQILYCKEQGVDGVVWGVLTNDNVMDVKACEALMACSEGLSVTFHRAIDECTDISKQIGLLSQLGVTRVLTSGGKKTAMEGFTHLKTLQEKFAPSLTIMPGGGIRSTNLSHVLKTGCHEFHSAAITAASDQADAHEIKKLRSILSSAS